MITTKLATFALALAGIGLTWIYKTWRMDVADTEHDLTPLDVIWRGPARWKTILNVAFIAVVTFFFPPAYLEAAIAASIGGAQLGWGLPVVFGVASEGVMILLFQKAIDRGGDAKAE